MKKMQKGFTLIELLVVVAIIAILALIVMLALNPVEMARRSRDSRRLADLSTLRKAVDLALADGKSLPTSFTSRTTSGGGSKLTSSDATNNLVGMDISKYISTIPQDPDYDTSGTNQTTDGTGCGTATPGKVTIDKSAMVYTFLTDGDTYELDSYLESTDNCGIVSGDGGSATAKYELGTKLTY